MLHSLLGLLILVSCTPLNGMSWFINFFSRTSPAEPTFIDSEKVNPNLFLNAQDLLVKITYTFDKGIKPPSDGLLWGHIRPSLSSTPPRYEQVTCKNMQKKEEYDITRKKQEESRNAHQPRNPIYLYKATYKTPEATYVFDEWKHYPPNYSCTTAQKELVYRQINNNFKGFRPQDRELTTEKLDLEKAREISEAEEKLNAAKQESANDNPSPPPAYDHLPSAPPLGTDKLPAAEPPLSTDKPPAAEASLFRSQQSTNDRIEYANDSPPPPSSLDRNSIIVGVTISAGFLLFLYCVKTVLTKSKSST